MVHEIIHSVYHRKEVGMLVKTNMSKAYDQVAWDFLINFLQAFGFNEA